MTQRQLAYAAGLSLSQLRKYELGTKCPGPKNLEKLARTLGSTPSELKDKAKKENTPLRSIREALGMSQSQLSRLTGINRCQLRDYEAGAYQIGWGNLKKLSEALGCDTEDLQPGSCEPVERYTTEERNKLVLQNLEIVRAVVYKHRVLVRVTGYSEEDLFQDLVLRLIRVVETYDPGKGGFGAYAYKSLYYFARDICQEWANRGITGGPPLTNFSCSLDAMAEKHYQAIG